MRVLNSVQTLIVYETGSEIQWTVDDFSGFFVRCQIMKDCEDIKCISVFKGKN